MGELWGAPHNIQWPQLETNPSPGEPFRAPWSPGTGTALLCLSPGTPWAGLSPAPVPRGHRKLFHPLKPQECHYSAGGAASTHKAVFLVRFFGGLRWVLIGFFFSLLVPVSVLVIAETLEEVMDGQTWISNATAGLWGSGWCSFRHIISKFCVNRALPFPRNKSLGWTVTQKAAITHWDQLHVLPGGWILDHWICQECRAAPGHPLMPKALGILDIQAEISRNPFCSSSFVPMEANG